MKTSIFDMNFVLPPVAVMTEVEKDMIFCVDCFTGRGKGAVVDC